MTDCSALGPRLTRHCLCFKGVYFFVNNFFIFIIFINILDFFVKNFFNVFNNYKYYYFFHVCFFVLESINAFPLLCMTRQETRE